MRSPPVMNAIKFSYYAALGLFSLRVVFSVFNDFSNYTAIEEAFQSLNYPTYLTYPLAIAKILGLIAIWSKKSVVLKE